MQEVFESGDDSIFADEYTYTWCLNKSDSLDVNNEITGSS